MATKKTMKDDLTVAVPQKEAEYVGPTADVFIPELEDGGGGMKVDQYEHVTIANEEKERIYHVHRGERVTVPVPVFMALKEKYPNI